MTRAMWIIWPAFLVAGLLEVLVFSVVDPAELLSLLDAGWSRTGLYSAAFFMFWGLVAAASALSLWLAGAFDASRPSGTEHQVVAESV